MNPRLRNVIIFVTGFLVIAHQTLLRDQPSPTLVGAALTMMVGAPAMYRFLDKFESATPPTPPPKGKAPT